MTPIQVNELHEAINIVLAVTVGYFWGNGYGYKRATRDYHEEIDKTCKVLQNGRETIIKLRTLVDKLRLRLAGKAIQQLRQKPENLNGSRPS